MAKILTKTTCTRCNGSGTYSFNYVRGTVCFKCEGKGTQMTDLVAVARKKKSDEKRHALQAASAEKFIAMAQIVKKELNALYGPFDINTDLGVDQLNKATFVATGKSIWKIRDERIESLA